MEKWREGRKNWEHMHVSFLRVRWSERTPLESFHSLLSELGFSFFPSPSHSEFNICCVY